MNIRQLRLMNPEAGRISAARLSNSAVALGLDSSDFPETQAAAIVAHAKSSSKTSPKTPKSTNQAKSVDTGAIVAKQTAALAQVAQSGATQGRQRGEVTLAKFTDSLSGAFQGAQVQSYLETVSEGVETITAFLAGEYNGIPQDQLPESVTKFLSHVGNDSLTDLEDALTVDVDAVDLLDQQFSAGALPDGDDD